MELKAIFMKENLMAWNRKEKNGKANYFIYILRFQVLDKKRVLYILFVCELKKNKEKR